MKKDNSTLKQKVAIRRATMERIKDPVVMETNGGRGEIWKRCYSNLEKGVVFEIDPSKASILARQRPSWAVYQCDAVAALRDGVGQHRPVNFLDVDPYGDPWQIIDAFLESKRPKPSEIAVVVNDGLRMRVMRGGAKGCSSLEEMARRYGSRLYRSYVEICEILIAEKASKAGLEMTNFAGYYAGHGDNMTHYSAIFKRSGGVIKPGN